MNKWHSPTVKSLSPETHTNTVMHELHLRTREKCGCHQPKTWSDISGTRRPRCTRTLGVTCVRSFVLSLRKPIPSQKSTPGRPETPAGSFCHTFALVYQLVPLVSYSSLPAPIQHLQRHSCRKARSGPHRRTVGSICVKKLPLFVFLFLFQREFIVALQQDTFCVLIGLVTNLKPAVSSSATRWLFCCCLRKFSTRVQNLRAR